MATEISGFKIASKGGKDVKEEGEGQPRVKDEQLEELHQQLERLNLGANPFVGLGAPRTSASASGQGSPVVAAAAATAAAPAASAASAPGAATPGTAIASGTAAPPVPAPAVPRLPATNRGRVRMEQLKIPTFNGLEPVDRFVETIDGMQAQSGANDNTVAGAVKNALKEGAYNWFLRQSMEETEGLTRWKNEAGATADDKAKCLRSLLLKRFSPKMTMAEIQMKTASMKMKQDEPVEMFEDRCHILQHQIEALSKAENETADMKTQRIRMHEAAVTCMFLNGLPKELRDKMNLKTKEEDLKGYVAAAKLLQQTSKDDRKKVVNEVATESSEQSSGGARKKKPAQQQQQHQQQQQQGGQHGHQGVEALVNQLVSAIKGQSIAGGQSSGAKPKKDPDAVMCFNCKEFGHRARNCPLPPTEETLEARRKFQERKARQNSVQQVQAMHAPAQQPMWYPNPWQQQQQQQMWQQQQQRQLQLQHQRQAQQDERRGGATPEGWQQDFA